MPAYQGTWFFTYRSTGCEESGDWRDGCVNVDLTRFFTTQLTIQQNRDQVTGQIKPYSDIDTVPLAGLIALDGRLTANGVVD